jgi:hypothetical protein
VLGARRLGDLRVIGRDSWEDKWGRRYELDARLVVWHGQTNSAPWFQHWNLPSIVNYPALLSVEYRDPLRPRWFVSIKHLQKYICISGSTNSLYKHLLITREAKKEIIGGIWDMAQSWSRGAMWLIIQPIALCCNNDY